MNSGFVACPGLPAGQRCAKNADGEQPNVFLNMCEKADWLV